MFLNSVILILQEILEAALLVSVLLAFTRQLSLSSLWISPAIIAGLLGGYIYSKNFDAISELFDYVGQEVFNASLQTLIVIFMFVITILYSRLNYKARRRDEIAFSVCAAIIIALAMTREGTEIYLYLTGALSQPEFLLPTLSGSTIGAGIGMSIGVLLYFGLTALTGKRGYTTGLVLLALIAGNMAAQATLQLTQADWLPTTSVLWNTSGLLPERSIIGRLLYGLIGYEATPSLLHFSTYLGIALIIFFVGKRKRIGATPST